MDCSPPGSSVHGILQARIPEWVAMLSSRRSSWPRDWTCVSYVSCIGRQVLYHQCHLERPLGHLTKVIIESKCSYYSVQLCLTQSLWPHGLQHARLPCPSPTSIACSHSCPSSWWYHPTISSSVVPFFSRLQSFSASGPFLESVLCIRWPNYWSFSFNIIPSNEYSGLISFRIDWFDLLAVQGTLKSFLQHHISKASIFQCSL